MTALVSPFPQWFDTDGSPLSSGYIYIGQADSNPETDPVSVFWDVDLTQPAAQPLRTSGGYVVRNGSPAVAYVSGDYSVTVKNNRGGRVFYAANSTEFSNVQQALDAIDTLRADMLSASDVAKGPALVGQGMTLSYAAGTVGYYVRGLMGRTTAETTAGVTPTNYLYPPGDIRRYGGVGDDATACDAAFNAAFAQWDANGVPVYLPRGTYQITAGFTRTTRLEMYGDGKFQSWIKAVGFASDSSILTMTGSTPGTIDGWKIKGICFTSDNLAPRALTMTWCRNGLLEDCYFYEVRRGWYGDSSYLNTFRGVSVYLVQQETWVLGPECNNNTFISCGIRSVNSHGMSITGNVASISLVGCNIEGIDTIGKAGIYIAPVTTKRVSGVSIQGCYFERIKGSAIELAGADAASVGGLVVKGNQIFGGFVSLLASAAGTAQTAIILANVDGFEISDNDFIDWQVQAFFRSGTETNGEVHINRSPAIPALSVVAVPALTNSSNQFSASVDVQNNFAGRRVEYLAAMPSSGAYTVGDLVYDLNGNVLLWRRKTTGAAHVLGVDWIAVG